MVCFVSKVTVPAPTPSRPLCRWSAWTSVHPDRPLITKIQQTMKIQQIYTGCIAHAAYYLESEGEVAIFDPLREVQPYIDQA